MRALTFGGGGCRLAVRLPPLKAGDKLTVDGVFFTAKAATQFYAIGSSQGSVQRHAGAAFVVAAVTTVSLASTRQRAGVGGRRRWRWRRAVSAAA